MSEFIDQNYDRLNDKYTFLTTKKQIKFLLELISKIKNKNNSNVNILEIGVSTGCSSLFMLNKGIELFGKNFVLHSFDLDNSDYVASAVFDNINNDDLKQYDLHKGITFYQYCNENINEIENNKYDFAFIDAQHAHPGPLMDLLFVLPLMKEDSVIAFHDISKNHIAPNEYGATILFQSINEEDKYQLPNDNIGYIKINSKTKERIYKSIIEIAKQPFVPCMFISDQTTNFVEPYMGELKNFVTKFYSESFSTKIIDIFETNVNNFNMYKWNLVSNLRTLEYLFWSVETLKANTHNTILGYNQESLNLLANIYKNKKIILYGAGKRTEEMLKMFDFSAINIIGIADIKIKDESSCLGYKTIRNSEINNYNYDFICVLTQNKIGIKKYLKETLKVPETKIIEF